MCVCIHIHTHMYIWLLITHIHVHAHTYVYIYTHPHVYIYILSSPEDIFFPIAFRERGSGRVRERGRNISVREKHQLVAFLYLLIHTSMGIEPETWVCALTRNQTHNLLVHGMMLQPTEPCWPGRKIGILNLDKDLLFNCTVKQFFFLKVAG